MYQGGEPAPQGKPNSSLDGVTYQQIVIDQIQDREKLSGIFQITISSLSDKANKIYIKHDAYIESYFSSIA